MTSPRALATSVSLFLVHGLAREADRALGLVLRSGVEADGLLREVGRAAGAAGWDAVARVCGWAVAGIVAGLLLRRLIPGRESALLPLLLRPALTTLTLVSVALQPAYPYAFTLPVALGQDWGVAQDAAALAAILAALAPLPRWRAPRAGEVFLLSFLAYAALAPEWSLRWEGHPGNEPKYLRQAVALGHGLTFDAEGVTTAMERLPVRPLAESLGVAARTLAGESWRMAAALASGEGGLGSIAATRVTRQTVRGKEGGIYYVLAPAPSLLLAPTLRIDRALNLARGVEGRVAASVLAWCALAAALVAALFALVRDATERPGVAAALALGFALLPPFLFYFFQFYPEMLGALVLAVAFRTLALRPQGLARHPWLLGWLFAALPWLHQKFLPVWLAVAATALVVGWRARLPGRRWLVGLVATQAVSLYLFTLYNFAITGSVRPDALFLAWGPGGVTTARVGQGLLGILLDARYGILPYVPLLLVALAGLAQGGARRFAVVLPAAVIYYLTVASADNWAGAVCNLGRYFMPVAPLAVALVGIALVRVDDRARAGLALVLSAWSVLFALALWQDPVAANDSALLLAKGAFGDGNQYLPNLHVRRWSDAAPGLWARVASLVVVAVLLALAWARPRPLRTPVRALGGLLAVLLLLGFGLERWPAWRSEPRLGELPAPGGALVSFTGAATVREDEAILGPGAVELRARVVDPSSSEASRLRAIVGGEGRLLAAGLPPIVLRPSGAVVELPLVAYHEVNGRDGRRARLLRARLAVSGQAVLRFEAEAGQRIAEPATPGSR